MRCRNSKNMRQYELAFIEGSFQLLLPRSAQCYAPVWNYPLLYENTLFLGTVTRCSENQLGFTM